MFNLSDGGNPAPRLNLALGDLDLCARDLLVGVQGLRVIARIEDIISSPAGEEAFLQALILISERSAAFIEQLGTVRAAHERKCAWRNAEKKDDAPPE